MRKSKNGINCAADIELGSMCSDNKVRTHNGPLLAPDLNRAARKVQAEEWYSQWRAKKKNISFFHEVVYSALDS